MSLLICIVIYLPVISHSDGAWRLTRGLRNFLSRKNTKSMQMTPNAKTEGIKNVETKVVKTAEMEGAKKVIKVGKTATVARSTNVAKVTHLKDSKKGKKFKKVAIRKSARKARRWVHFFTKTFTMTRYFISNRSAD